ncbi:hypothetical protein ELI30_09000 [Rhizobium leguminosarum]|uniref:hypothetical protein n=1 Tax=Rhizobium leguminosarum TaxID=384 RepID=UPI001032472D|nr:hypothetical protein [Rhizobium leguminosarum]TAV48427.1 hypothetical protein ELI32_09455 [Rhizobium leguminosarum]TAV57927.1 hypothetical protein ELI31_08985 [Rhizobium leguminosarum]TAV68868.1 hypothetical protein ELI30_09000 [Rhizobium leguminosarum]
MSAPTVRAKFRCSGKEGNTCFFHTVWSEDIQSENGRFTVATPWGELRMTVDNPSAAIQFEPGQEYYLDFTPAD